MEILIGPLGRAGISARFGAETEAGLRAALFHYAAKLRTGREPVEYPSFLQNGDVSGSAETIEVEVEQAVEEAIVAEAKRQGRSVAELAGHAVLVYLAELESVGARLPPEDPAGRSRA